MPRIARYVEENGYYHVVSRSINQTWALRDPEDFARFRQLIREAKEKFPIRLFHYALMNTHFHFVLQAVTKNFLARHLAYVKWYYTQWMRKKYRWRGPLWRERYKSLPIEDETYLAACGFYVEFNPVRAGICDDPAQYPHSSYRAHHQGAVDDLLDGDPVNSPSDVSTPQHFTTPLAKRIFSQAPAIGSALFVEQHRRQHLPVPKCDSHNL